MGKNYVENSLKRFLKRKVKITLGFVVAFMISGTIGFAEPNIVGEDNHIKNEWFDEVEQIKDFGSILDKEIKIERTDNGKDKSITISKTHDNTLGDIIVISLKNAQEGTNKFEDINLGISLKYLSNDTFEYLKTSLANIDKAVSAGNINDSIQKSDELLKMLNADITDESKKYKGYYTAQIADGKEVENTGIIMKDTDFDTQTLNVGQTAINGGIIKNSGVIANEGRIAQYARGENSKAYNYGLISNIDKETGTANNGFGNGTGGAGQKAYDNAEVYNYGIIAKNFKSGQWADKNSKAYNYGIIFNERKFAQKVGEGSAAYNFGTLTSNLADHIGGISNPESDFGSHMQASLGGEVYNYGIIHTNRRYAQIILDVSENKNGGGLYNYGIIDTTSTLAMALYNRDTWKKSEGYNYGIINGNSKASASLLSASSGTGINYGLINDKGDAHSLSASKNGTGINYGIIIANNEKGVILNDETAQRYALNYGIGLKRNVNGELILHNQDILEEKYKEDINKDGTIKNYNVNNDTYNLTVNKTITEIENDNSITVANQKNNIFVNNLGKDSNVTLTVDKDTLDSKHITAVFGKESKGDTAVKANSNLTLNNSSIVGYFEKNGTLLNVNGNLTLSGNSVINAITGNEYTGYTGDKLDDVVAVKLSNNGKLEIKDSSMVLGTVEGNGTIVYENTENESHFNKQDIDSILINTTTGETTEIALGNVTLKDSGTGVQNAGKLVIDNQSSEKLEGKEISTSITFAKNINIQKGIDGSSSSNGIELILGDGQNSSDNSIKVGGEILLGQANDTIIINNILGKYDETQKAVVIDGGENKDTVILKNSNGNHDTFDYALKNVETLDLNNQTWKIGENASIEFGNSGTTTKADDKITVQNGTLMGEMKFDIDENGNSAEFSNNNIDDVLGKTDFSTEKGKEGYLQLGIGENSKLQAGAEYDMNITDETKQNLENMKDNITVSGIFGKGTGKNEIRVKTAQEMGINGRYSELYNQMLENTDKEEVRDVLNNVNSSDIADVINSKGAMADTLATSGYKITRDISNSFISSVNEWNKKANKGEWLANAKYINSDVEYDGANSVKGYDSDLASMVGMIEYGVSDNTSYGVALGGGDTEVDVNGAGTLEGDNYYIGAYTKHSVNGFDLVGNLGYTISDLEVDGNGSADSSAITLAGYVKRDIKLSETVKIEPNLAFTYDYIMQDDAEGNGVKVENKDVHVFEATAGMNIVKEFAFNNGNLELKAGIKYSMADINRNEETIISAFGMEPVTLGNPEVDKTRGTVHIGFDYEHETGFGVNGKYETMWSASGDDSRVTAGISYRF